ncbi:hypothetical protein [Paracoccus marinaquae]|uniref:Uncharacterized protein n=1 Tax=Paracoccus marinaquae TaxID=2841926 RepID=A0ABS6AQD3_9RHOB|nr:hypothetical protein [Paracoccus marinaquae]MBU3031840.1 hypothetical protein [Paracoccus marinaquae]
MTPRVQDSIAEILESMVLRLDTAMAGLQHHWDMPGCDLPFSDRPSQH